MAKSPTYNIWCGIVARCTDPNARGFIKYGAKGITICQRWRESFEAFYADMGERPRGLTVDRIDNARGYEPDNCRWATMREQQNNRTNNNRLTHAGRSLTMMEWSRETGIERATITRRLKLGWSIADALTKPSDPTAGRFQFGEDPRNGIRHPR